MLLPRIKLSMLRLWPYHLKWSPAGTSALQHIEPKSLEQRFRELLEQQK